jgi:hypothetical protein
MNTATRLPDGITDDIDLLQLQLEIARRADELRSLRGYDPECATDRDLWLEAEQDVLAVTV